MTAPSATVAARSIVRLATDQTVPANAVGTMVQWSRPIGRRRTSSAPASTGGTSTATASRSVHRHAGAPIVPPTAPATLSLRAIGRHAEQQWRSSCRTCSAVNKLVADAQRARGQLAELRRAHLETHGRDGAAEPRQPRFAAREGRHRGQPARRRVLYRISDACRSWGDFGWGFRAPTLNELYRQFRVGCVRDAGEREPRSRAPVRRRGRRQTRSRSQHLGPLDLVRQPRQGSGVERHASADEPPAAAEPRDARAFAAGRTTWRCASIRRFESTAATCSTTRR